MKKSLKGALLKKKQKTPPSHTTLFLPPPTPPNLRPHVIFKKKNAKVVQTVYMVYASGVWRGGQQLFIQPPPSPL